MRALIIVELCSMIFVATSSRLVIWDGFVDVLLLGLVCVARNIFASAPCAINFVIWLW